MSDLQSRARHLVTAALMVVVGVLSGCAHQNMRDPLEPLNRGIYTFNDAVDKAVLKPVATGYRAVLPQLVRTGVSNFFSNLDDITVIVNNLLQLKIPQAVSDTGRFVINTTIGVLGLFDVATHFGLEKHNEDFGQTLGYWGLGSGPYLVLPFLGPSSFRDGVGRLVDKQTDVVVNLDHIRTRNQFWGTRVINTREQLLDSEKVLDAAAIDRYAFIRDAYLQRRRNLVYDGNPPPDPDDALLDEKPRSELPVPSVSILVDRFGGVVAGAPSEASRAQVDTGPTQVTQRDSVLQMGKQEGGPDTDRPTSGRDSVKPTDTASPIAKPARNAELPRFIRVWLPGAAAP